MWLLGLGAILGKWQKLDTVPPVYRFPVEPRQHFSAASARPLGMRIIQTRGESSSRREQSVIIRLLKSGAHTVFIQVLIAISLSDYSAAYIRKA